ncbi:MAG: CoA pyrophosphatase [Myxococcota bacterium]
MSLPTLASVRQALSRHERRELPALPGRTNHLSAGVLVPLRWREDVEVLLTLRTSHLSLHAGEISFPGGRRDAEDVNLEATALREAREEIGLMSAEVIGRLSSIPLYTSDYRLDPYVAHVGETQLAINPDEVERLVVVGVREILDRDVQHGIPWEHAGQRYLAPVFETEARLVFGGTAYALWELVQVLAPAFERPTPALTPGKYSWQDVL